MKRIPRMNSALYIGVHVGAETDAHRVMSYNPWVALRWMFDGKTADLAVLSKDYFKVPVEETGEIEAVMTVVGGRVVYAEKAN